MVVISQAGHVNGEICAEKIVVNGLVEGSCVANGIEILEKGKITGSAYSDNLSIDRGGLFFGYIHPMADQPVVKIEKINNIKVKEAVSERSHAQKSSSNSGGIKKDATIEPRKEKV
jgi:cytoskeletal protein CcmA (bactofilin family)